MRQPEKHFVVVLGAPNEPSGELSSVARARLDLALRTLEEESDAVAVLTGGFGDHFNTTTVPHGELARRYLLERGLAPDRIYPTIVESSNTIEDATLTRALLEPFLPCRVTVVTSDFHAARAGRSFRDALGSVELVVAVTEDGDELLIRMQHEVAALQRLHGEPDTSISIPHHGFRVNLRTAAVIVADEHLLLQQVAGTARWFLPGGRVKVDEPASEALARELAEELPFTTEIGRLLWVVENFYSWPNGDRVHEIGFIFMTEPVGTPPMEDHHLIDGPAITCRWFPLSAIGDVDVRPHFLRRALTAPPEAPAHVVVRDSISL